MMTPYEEAQKLRRKKSEDYNAGGVELREYFPFGLKSYAQELHKKTLRLVSIAKKDFNLRIEETTANESVRENALDLMNYAAFLVEAIDRGEL